jgi:hypothetical protein
LAAVPRPELRVGDAEQHPVSHSQVIKGGSCGNADGGAPLRRRPIAFFGLLVMMMIDRRAVVAALPISLFLAHSVEARPRHRYASHDAKFSWDGTWSGNWGGQGSQATSVTIANNNVVSFEYHGVSTPVPASRVTPTSVSYGYGGVSVIMTRTGATTAMASLHGPMGDATARLTKR